MKILPQATFTLQDIKEALNLGSFHLPKLAKLPNGIVVRYLKEGSVTHLYLCSGTQKKIIGVASIQKDMLSTIHPVVKGIRISQMGLLREYRGLGLMWKLMSVLLQNYRVFASPAMTKKGRDMWITRIKLDITHPYLLYRPKGFQGEGSVKLFLPINKNNVSKYKDVMWDGSLKTRLLLVSPADPLIKRYELDWKSS